MELFHVRQPKQIQIGESVSMKRLTVLVLMALWALPGFAQTGAASQPKVDTGDTAWVLISAALVLFMTIPGLALFYGGLVRTKNVLGTLMQSFIMVGYRHAPMDHHWL